MRITRREYGDVIAQADGPMTVAELIRALQAMPPGATVLRYCDWTVHRVLYEHPGDKVELH